MNILNNSNHPVKKQNIEYFVHLVRIALADDIITDNEMLLLRRLGKKLGFTELETETLINSTGKYDYIPPSDFDKRFEQVYDIVKMTLADGVIDDSEMRLASSFARSSGFSENEIPKLLVLLISGIKQGKNDEELFEVYKKERR
jgi:uncharacterized tellurite resistance protein B-like protein